MILHQIYSGNGGFIFPGYSVYRDAVPLDNVLVLSNLCEYHTLLKLQSLGYTSVKHCTY